MKRIIEGGNILRTEEGHYHGSAKVFINDAYLGDFTESEIEDFIKGFNLLIKMYSYKPKFG